MIRVFMSVIDFGRDCDRGRYAHLGRRVGREGQGIDRHDNGLDSCKGHGIIQVHGHSHWVAVLVQGGEDARSLICGISNIIRDSVTTAGERQGSAGCTNASAIENVAQARHVNGSRLSQRSGILLPKLAAFERAGARAATSYRIAVAVHQLVIDNVNDTIVIDIAFKPKFGWRYPDQTDCHSCVIYGGNGESVGVEQIVARVPGLVDIELSL